MTETVKSGDDYVSISLSKSPLKRQFEEEQPENEEDELKRLLLPDVSNLPLSPPSSVETNFVRYFAIG